MTDLLSLITPTNLLEEQVKFFASSTYHPTFHYIWQVEEINPEFSIKQKYPLWEAIKSQNSADIIQAAKNIFDTEINAEMLSYANKIILEKPTISPGSPNEIQVLFQESFNHFALDYQAIIVDLPGFNLRPRHSEKKLLISSHIHFGYMSMEAEVHHELAHIIRYRNGKFNNIKRSQNFLPTEEGLAAWCQDHTNNDSSLAQHALEYVVSSIGLNGSLRDIYDFLVSSGMPKELAWKRAARHKFGFVDTSQAGDILKPAMYFAHENKIDKLSRSEKLRLFIGKIALSELPQYPDYVGLYKDSDLISYFKL